MQRVDTITGSSVLTLSLATTVDVGSATLGHQGGPGPWVEESCEIKQIEIMLHAYFQTAPAAVRHFTIIVRKNIGSYLPAVAVGDALILGQKPWKDFIFHVEQAQPGVWTNGGVPMPYNIILRVPRRYRKMNSSDVWEVIVIPVDVGAADVWDVCTFAKYSWYK